MAKLHKMTIYLTDYNNYYGDIEDIIVRLENAVPDGAFSFYDYDSTDVEWHDDIDINKVNAKKGEYEAYFSK